MEYTIDDIEVLDDPVAVIRLRAGIYAGEAPRAARLAGGLAAQLVEDGESPVQVDRAGQWWLISCGADWLASPRLAGLDCWRRMIPAGLNAIRPEVILTALSDAVFTTARGRTDWIVRRGPGPVHAPPAATWTGPGRVVGFLMNEDAPAPRSRVAMESTHHD